MKKLTEKVWSTGHGWSYEALFAAGVHDGERLRVKIDRDAYDYQNRCVVEIYNAASNSWNQLAAVPFPLMKSNAINYVSKTVTAAAFAGDVETLLAEAAMII
jgi:hypothetical protein